MLGASALGLNTPLPALSLESGKVEFARVTQYLYSFMDSANLCQFVWGPSWQLYGPEHMIKMINAVTGWDISVKEALEVGERRLNMMRAFNALNGIDSQHDRLSDKFVNKPLHGGPSDGWHVDKAALESAITEYYHQSGWNEKSGIPSRDTLNRLGLDWVADKLGQ